MSIIRIDTKLMITSPTNTKKSNMPVLNAIELLSLGKKYPFFNKISGQSSNDRGEEFWALKDVSLDVYKGQTIGVIGRNGAGKTTLLNIVSGVLSPTAGKSNINGRVLGLFNLGAGFLDELTGRENIFLNGAILGATKKELDSNLNSIIEFSELGDFINIPLGTYSQGMRLRLGFSIIANLSFDILVIDEVLAVGDALFQNKCFERLIDFKRLGKTLIITTQAMDLVERLCDKVVLLDHGALLFSGEALEGINRYRKLLNTEKFFVGLPQRKSPGLIENTKKWADNISDWDNKFGGREIVIDSVKFVNKYGVKASRINTRGALRIKVSFTVRDRAEKPHFGIAIFRKDGVYCYGPNTEFDGYTIPELRQGRGYFILDYRRLLLAPGDYKVSIAIWDKNESLAFDHHYGYYELIVTGAGNSEGGFLNMPFEISYSDMGYKFFSFFANKKDKTDINLGLLQDKFGQTLDDNNIKVEYVKFLDHSGNRKDIFMTNECAKFIIGLDFKKIAFNDNSNERFSVVRKVFSTFLYHKQPVNKGLYLWFGIYRDDGVYCQGATISLRDCKNYSILFPKLSLLPGLYSISIGIWDSIERKFLMYHHGIYLLKMVFDKQDHGTVYLDHKWSWEVS